MFTSLFFILSFSKYAITQKYVIENVRSPILYHKWSILIPTNTNNPSNMTYEYESNLNAFKIPHLADTTHFNWIFSNYHEYNENYLSTESERFLWFIK